MIGHISGTLFKKNPQSVIIDTAGVGYQIFIPLSTFYFLPEKQEKVNLHIYTYVRENLFQLFGFQTETEKEIFLLLISISGIGPKLALNILSGIGLDELLHAIRTADSEKLSSIPGVGKKTAQRITLELKEKVSNLPSEVETTPKKEITIENEGIFDDATSALINLGYPNKSAKKAVESVLHNNSELNLEAVLRKALQDLAQ